MCKHFIKLIVVKMLAVIIDFAISKIELFILVYSIITAAGRGQISLAWILGKKPYLIPIPGSRKPHRLKENFDVQNIMLSVDEITQIDTLLDGLDLKVFGGHAVD